MKQVILILTLLIMNAYAGNCYLMSNDELREIESSYWDNWQVSVKFPSGVLCNHARFLNVRTFSGMAVYLRMKPDEILFWVDVIQELFLMNLECR